MLNTIMASSKKRRVLEEESNDPEMEEDQEVEEQSDDDVTDESENEFMDQEVQVEFEARSPDDGDADGIKTLLHQLFLKANINLSDLKDIIISQNYIGGVIKQMYVEEDDEDSMDEDSDDAVFGLTTAINITDKKDMECVKQLVSMVTSRCQSADPAVGGKVTELLHQEENHVGFLLNERFINIPPQIAVPSLKSLRKDLEKACKKKMNYSFQHFLMLCKTYRFKQQAQANGAGPALFFSNAEEELIAEMSDLQATWSVADERDGVADGRWDEDEMEATRTVLVFSADKLEAIIGRIEKQLAT